MIEQVKHFTTKILRLPQKVFGRQKTVNFDLPKLKQLDRDVVELSKKNESIQVLPNSPNIIIGKYNTHNTDERFKYFGAEFRAYTSPGYDNVFPNNYLCIDSKNGMCLKPHVYITYIEVKPEYARQGIYTEAMKNLIQLVKEDEECEGRIVLDALKTQYSKTKIPSPSLAHWKCGFRFADERNNEIMDMVLKGKLPLEEAPEGTMYYAGV